MNRRPLTIPSFTIEGLDPNQRGVRILMRLAELGVPLNYDDFLDRLHLYLFGTVKPEGCLTDIRPPFVNLIDTYSLYQTFLPRPARVALLPLQSVILGEVPANLERLIYWHEPPSCFVTSTLQRTLPTDPELLPEFLRSHLGLAPLQFADVFQPMQVIDWLQPLANRYVPALQHLHLGNLVDFFINLVYAGAYLDLQRYPDYCDRFRFLIQATYGLPIC